MIDGSPWSLSSLVIFEGPAKFMASTGLLPWNRATPSKLKEAVF